VDRFEQISPQVLFTVNAVMYNGKVFPQMEKIKTLENSKLIAGIKN
jgi:hypothetical protein